MGKWSEFEERYGEFREDFIDTDEEDVERCIYCDTTERVQERRFTLFGKPKKELICLDCLEEELEEENESCGPVQDVYK